MNAISFGENIFPAFEHGSHMNAWEFWGNCMVYHLERFNTRAYISVLERVLEFAFSQRSQGHIFCFERLDWRPMVEIVAEKTKNKAFQEWLRCILIIYSQTGGKVTLKESFNILIFERL
jgi:hypothetical protein